MQQLSEEHDVDDERPRYELALSETILPEVPASQNEIMADEELVLPERGARKVWEHDQYNEERSRRDMFLQGAGSFLEEISHHAKEEENQEEEEDPVSFCSKPILLSLIYLT